MYIFRKLGTSCISAVLRLSIGAVKTLRRTKISANSSRSLFSTCFVRGPLMQIVATNNYIKSISTYIHTYTHMESSFKLNLSRSLHKFASTLQERSSRLIEYLSNSRVQFVSRPIVGQQREQSYFSPWSRRHIRRPMIHARNNNTFFFSFRLSSTSARPTFNIRFVTVSLVSPERLGSSLSRLQNYRVTNLLDIQCSSSIRWRIKRR